MEGIFVFGAPWQDDATPAEAPLAEAQPAACTPHGLGPVAELPVQKEVLQESEEGFDTVLKGIFVGEGAEAVDEATGLPRPAPRPGSRQRLRELRCDGVRCRGPWQGRYGRCRGCLDLGVLSDLSGCEDDDDDDDGDGDDDLPPASSGECRPFVGGGAWLCVGTRCLRRIYEDGEYINKWVPGVVSAIDTARRVLTVTDAGNATEVVFPLSDIGPYGPVQPPT